MVPYLKGHAGKGRESGWGPGDLSASRNQILRCSISVCVHLVPRNCAVCGLGRVKLTAMNATDNKRTMIAQVITEIRRTRTGNGLFSLTGFVQMGRTSGADIFLTHAAFLESDGMLSR